VLRDRARQLERAYERGEGPRALLDAARMRMQAGDLKIARMQAEVIADDDRLTLWLRDDALALLARIRALEDGDLPAPSGLTS